MSISPAKVAPGIPVRPFQSLVPQSHPAQRVTGSRDVTVSSFFPFIASNWVQHGPFLNPVGLGPGRW